MSEPRASVLVVEDDAHLADQLRWALKDSCQVSLAADRIRALSALRRQRPDILLLDLCLPPDHTTEEGFRILRAAQDNGGDTLVVVMSATDQREHAVRAVAEGAYDFFSKPVDMQALRVVVARALERLALGRENRRLREQLRERYQIEGIIGISESMSRVLDAIRRVKDSQVTVMLYGESGTGKELVARAIHHGGGRSMGPFVPLHCAALPENLLEAELFGHERGAFTGAVEARMGRFEAAHGGTLFLDEVASLSPTMQVKLLRVLEERCIERLGSNVAKHVDIRLIAASNEDLKEKVRRGEFREDLFFRINVFPIRLPPLRERKEDIPLLAEHFLRHACADNSLPSKHLDPQARQALACRPWPGNIRELRNFIETLVLMSDGPTIGLAALPLDGTASAPQPGFERAQAVGFKQTLEEFERALLQEAIARAKGAKGRAAAELGLDASQMKYLVKKHGL